MSPPWSANSRRWISSKHPSYKAAFCPPSTSITSMSERINSACKSYVHFIYRFVLGFICFKHSRLYCCMHSACNLYVRVIYCFVSACVCFKHCRLNFAMNCTCNSYVRVIYCFVSGYCSKQCRFYLLENKKSFWRFVINYIAQFITEIIPRVREEPVDAAGALCCWWPRDACQVNVTDNRWR